MLLPDPDDIHSGHALGLLITGAIVHLTAKDYCCPTCCPSCSALDFYRTQPVIADTAVGLALGQQRLDWMMDDGTLNWPYLVQFWQTPPEHVCHRDA